jgi:4-hydroxy-tetrahydrodipicolinate synthase
LVLYNIPHLTKTPIAPETVLQLARSPRIIGIKDSSGDITAARRLLLALRQAGRADMKLLLGTDILIDVTLVMGAHGVVPSLANLAPAVLVAAWDAAAAGNWAESSVHLERANRLTRLYQVNQQKMEGGIIPGLKGALAMIGINCGPPAAPMPALDAAQRQQVEAILRDEGVLAPQ